MKKYLKIFKSRLWEVLAVVFGALMAVMFVVNQAIIPFNNEISSFLNTQDYVETKVSLADGEEEKVISRPASVSADDIEEYYRSVNEQIEGEGLVLLKNENNALPLTDGSNVSFALSGSANIFYATHGPGVRREGTLIDLKTAIESQTSLKVNQKIYDFLSTGEGKSSRGIKGGVFRTDEKGWSYYSQAGLKDEYKNSGNAVIAVITRESGEGVDISWNQSDGIDGSYLSLTADELSVLEGLAQMKRAGEIEKIVVLINSAVTINCDFLNDERYGVDAAMWIGLPGATGMNSVAKALVGTVNPSGKLSDTFLNDNFASPAAMYWKVNNGFSSSYENATEMGLNSSQEYYGVYVEGVYVGYRYFETRYEDYVMKTSGVGEYDYSADVAYPFGYGLSYTTFGYSDLTVTEVKDSSGNVSSYNVSVKVTNNGTVAGKNTAQIYLQKPYSDYSKMYGIEKPSVELVGFGKTDTLEPGESQVLSATLDDTNSSYMRVAFEQLRSYDSENAQTYILDKGDYYLTVANDSHEAINNILAYKGYSMKDGMDSTGNADMATRILNTTSVDKEIFSTSSAKAHDTPTTLSDTANGTEITNQLDFMDPNRFSGVTDTASSDGDVTYVSRSNWVGTLPSTKTALALTSAVSEKYDITSHKSIVEEDGATMPTFGDMSSSLTLAMMEGLSYDDPQWDDLLNQISQNDMFITLTNCYGYTPALASVAKPYTDEDDGPYGVSNTTEGFSSMSCEGIIASCYNIELFQKVGEAIANDARSGHDEKQKNLDGLYAPGLNIHRVAFGGRAAEYFSEDPYLSGIAAMNEIIAMQEQNVVAHPKHFIFNDEESNRNGISIWMNEQAAREIYLLPWEYALRSDMGNAHALMTSFNRAGCLWTSASDNLMENIIRGEWSFDGYTLTDMAGSNGKLFMVYDDGFMNGTDCFLDKGTISGLSSAMKNSATFNTNLRTSMHRLLYVIANYSSAMDGYSNRTRLVSVTVWWKALITAFTVVFTVFTVISALMFVASQVVNKKYKSKQKETNDKLKD
jgi:beta-glucosidase